MNLFVLLSFLLLGVAAFVVQKKRRFDQIDILHLLFVSAVAVLLKSDFEEEQAANVWTYSLIALLAVNFLLSRWSKLRRPLLRLIPPAVTFGVFLALFWSDSFVYLGKNLNISDKATLVLPFLGIIAYEAAQVSMSFLQRYFGMRSTAENILMSFIIAIAALIGGFNAQGYGVFLVAAGFAAASFYNTIGSKHILHSLLAVSMVWMFAEANELQVVDLRFPKVIGGLFIGAFVALLIQQVWTIERKSNWALIFSYLFCALLFIGMLDFETRLHPSFGGVEAFLGGLIGFAIANSVLYFHERKEHLRQAPMMMSGLALIMLIGMVFPPLYVNEEQEAILKSLEVMTETNEEGEPEEIAYISFEGLSGNYDIVSKESVISFKLGPAGSVTKGAIKDFSGNFNFSDDLTQTSFEVKLPVLNLTTFVPMRDKSIMDDTYFNEAKFPLMRFKGSQFKPNEAENGYDMVGQFEMMGVKKEKTVLIRRVEEDGKIILVGNGKIDRTEFGMSDDPREGNLVDFEFKVELKAN
ncbi:MAG: YceI family protein [Crocinitomicaceae bacterium]|nr:YceI family protein [Crocinitomicaceae bacterium]